MQLLTGLGNSHLSCAQTLIQIDELIERTPGMPCTFNEA